MSNKNNKENKKIRRNQRQLEEQKAGAFEFMQKINSILAKIRVSDTGIMETTPSESVTENKQVITRVIFPNDGGVITYFDKAKHPCKGFCYGETVETVDEVKKTLMAFLSGFFENIAKSKIRTLLFALLFRKQFITMFKRLIIQVDYRMRRVRQKPERYCLCAREFYRVFNLMATWYPDYKKEIKSSRNIWCMILEYDDAYRYTFQDVLPEFNKIKADKDIVKEIKNVLDITLERDNRGLFIKFLQIRKLLFLINLNKKLKTIVKRFFLELDLERIQMDVDDKFHARFKENYDWTKSKIKPKQSIFHEENIKQQKDNQQKAEEEKKEV